MFNTFPPIHRLTKREAVNKENNMITEADLLDPTLHVLSEKPDGRSTTTELRNQLRKRVKLDSHDLRPLRNRGDVCFDQIVRNMKCHRDVPGNIVHAGFARSVPGGLEITPKGLAKIGAELAQGSFSF